jgi:hypothetical protein
MGGRRCSWSDEKYASDLKSDRHTGRKEQPSHRYDWAALQLADVSLVIANMASVALGRSKTFGLRTDNLPGLDHKPKPSYGVDRRMVDVINLIFLKFSSSCWPDRE